MTTQVRQTARWLKRHGFTNGLWRLEERDKVRRKLREDLTAEEKERLKEYGVVECKSAGATRKR